VSSTSETDQLNDPAAAATVPATRHHEFLILGGGTGGITVAAQLCRKVQGADVAIVEPSEDHYYQPFWTLVGAGVVSKEASRRREQDVIPAGATWIRDSVAGFDPAASLVTLASGERVSYRYLVVAIGLALNWSAIDGLEGHLGRNGIVSNYEYDKHNLVAVRPEQHEAVFRDLETGEEIVQHYDLLHVTPLRARPMSSRRVRWRTSPAG